MSLRLTCSDFRHRDPINASLYHDFYLYVSDESLKRFRELSSNKLLNHHVRRCVFMGPQLKAIFDRPQKYVPSSIALKYVTNSFSFRLMLSRWLKESFSRAMIKGSMIPLLEADQIPIDSSSCFERTAILLSEQHFDATYPRRTINALQAIYSSALEEQSRLLSDGTYIEIGGRCLAQLPNARSIVLRDGDGSAPATHFEAPGGDQIPASTCWLGNIIKDPKARTLRYTRIFGDRLPESRDFTLKVLRLLTIAQAPISDMVSKDCLCS